MLSLLCTIFSFFFSSSIFFFLSKILFFFYFFLLFLFPCRRIKRCCPPPHIFFALKNLYESAFFAIYAAWSIFIVIRQEKIYVANIVYLDHHTHKTIHTHRHRRRVLKLGALARWLVGKGIWGSSQRLYMFEYHNNSENGALEFVVTFYCSFMVAY